MFENYPMEINEIVKKLISQASIIKWQYIVIHHSLTPDQKKNDWETIRKWHTGDHPQSNLNWKNIGYHFGIEKIKGKVTLHTGRELSEAGAHVLGFNDLGIGLLIVGNYDLSEPAPEVWEKAICLCKSLCWYFDISPQHVIGHRETYTILNKPVKKTCPGLQFDLNRFRNYIKT